MEKQYTAKQWAEIEGGHTMSESEQPQYGFIRDLNESKMFRTKQHLETSPINNVANTAMMQMLTLHIMYSDYNTAPIAKEYARRTIAGGTNFKQYRQSATDLYHTLHKATVGDTATAAAQIKSNKIKLPEAQLKQYLVQMASGKPVSGANNLLLRMERGLDIQEATYRSMRRLAGDWGKLPAGQRSMLATRLQQYYKTNAIRSDLYKPFQSYAKSGGYNIKGLDSAEKRITARSVATRAVDGAAAFAGGFVGGRAFGRSLVRGKSTQEK